MSGESRAEVRSNARDQFERLALISMRQCAGTHFEIANDFSINAVAVIPHDGTLNAAHFAHQVFNFTRFDADATHFELEVRDVVYITTAPLQRWNDTINRLVPTLGAYTSAQSLNK